MTESIDVEVPSRGVMAARTIIAYLAGFLAVANCMGALLVLHPAVLAHAVAIIVAFPQLRTRAEALAGMTLTTPAAVLLWLGATALGNIWLTVAAAFA
jgi:hypothetical protein